MTKPESPVGDQFNAALGKCHDCLLSASLASLSVALLRLRDHRLVEVMHPPQRTIRAWSMGRARVELRRSTCASAPPHYRVQRCRTSPERGNRGSKMRHARRTSPGKAAQCSPRPPAVDAALQRPDQQRSSTAIVEHAQCLIVAICPSARPSGMPQPRAWSHGAVSGRIDRDSDPDFDHAPSSGVADRGPAFPHRQWHNQCGQVWPRAPCAHRRNQSLFSGGFGAWCCLRAWVSMCAGELRDRSRSCATAPLAKTYLVGGGTARPSGAPVAVQVVSHASSAAATPCARCGYRRAATPSSRISRRCRPAYSPPASLLCATSADAAHGTAMTGRPCYHRR